MANATRIGSIDFWRGAVLVAILIDHIPGNVLEFITPRNFGLSDSAEAFVFLSGLSVGAIYSPRAQRLGVSAVAWGCLKRALRLYGVHVAITLAALLIFALAFFVSGLDDLISVHGRASVFHEPARGLPGIVLLSHQIGYFNILPLYIALMVWAPLAVAMTLSNPRLAVLVSACVYFVARGLGMDLPNWPQPGGWFFNPLAWQLLFTLGVVAATSWRTAPPRRTPVLVAASAVAVAASAIIVTDAAGLAPGLREAATAYLDLGKQNLGVARLVHFFALAYLVAVTPGLARLAAGRFGQELQRLGRHSLAIFAFLSLLSAGGQAALTILAAQVSSGVVSGLGITYTLVSIAALFALAHRLECKNTSAPLSSSVAASHAG